MKKLFFGALALLAASAAAVALHLWLGDAGGVPVTAAEVTVCDVSETASCSGTLSASARESVRPAGACVIEQVWVRPGDEVEAGQLLFSYRLLTDDELRSRLWAIVAGEAEQNADEAAGDVLAAAAFYAANGRIPDWFKSFYLELPAALPRGGSALARAGIGGTVTGVAVSPGDEVSGVLPAVTLVASGALTARVDVPQQYLNRVAPGQRVNLSTTAVPGVYFPGEVTAVDREAHASGGLLAAGETAVGAEIRLDLEDGRLVPGLSVRADVFLRRWTGAAVIPYAAIRRQNGTYRVWVLEEDGTVSSRTVEAVYEYAEGVVAADGAAWTGVRVVTDPPEGLADGMRVSAGTAG